MSNTCRQVQQFKARQPRLVEASWEGLGMPLLGLSEMETGSHTALLPLAGSNGCPSMPYA